MHSLRECFAWQMPILTTSGLQILQDGRRADGLWPIQDDIFFVFKKNGQQKQHCRKHFANSRNAGQTFGCHFANSRSAGQTFGFHFANSRSAGQTFVFVPANFRNAVRTSAAFPETSETPNFTDHRQVVALTDGVYYRAERRKSLNGDSCDLQDDCDSIDHHPYSIKTRNSKLTGFF